ncbi:jg12114 [Pararge aegeria aegeria]|uniref:Jg12114 protein n=1 Tax=Pararge aegeria aegeria TaxID=348720 RepID=A0A8S4QJ42_9NEOP|nr:jg12114 [Pararge aegeria aegeria]
MWNVESTVIVPIVVSVNGLLAKCFDHHFKKLSLGCWMKGQILKAVVLERRVVENSHNTCENFPHSRALTAGCLGIQKPRKRRNTVDTNSTAILQDDKYKKAQAAASSTTKTLDYYPLLRSQDHPTDQRGVAIMGKLRRWERFFHLWTAIGS